jgi:RNA recognition motif-containing protein
MGRDREGGSTSIYVGNLPRDVKSRELEDLFAKYGRVKMVEIKGKPGTFLLSF